MVRSLWLDDPRRVRPYELACVPGGGMGRVYLGWPTAGRPVAVTAIRAELADDPAFQSRFGRGDRCCAEVHGKFTALMADAPVGMAGQGVYPRALSRAASVNVAR
jgi:hypothetical protein